MVGLVLGLGSVRRAVGAVRRHSAVRPVGAKEAVMPKDTKVYR